ncbi:Basic 7S globulin 2 [Morella rubra]|uniref:Basic 7S globulin 2 n=1 Tax=Morella rubra TaxID=262757 RepID=A0A6A1VQI6_9ROSI|nr:Basic 7S globulin 2 [Morella rubra]
METTIYKAVIKAFSKALSKVPRGHQWHLSGYALTRQTSAAHVLGRVSLRLILYYRNPACTGGSLGQIPWCSCFFFLTHPTQAQRFHSPNDLLLPITKDVTTLQYVTKILHGTPLVPIKVVVDLGGPFLWTNCASRYASSSILRVPNRSIQCSRAKTNGLRSKTCLSSAQTCELLTENRVTRRATRGELVEDIVAVQLIDGSKNAGEITNVHHVLFSCAPTFLLNGLGSGAKGMLGLGRTRISLPSQISTALGTPQKFTICLSSSEGILVSDQGPHDSVFGTEISKSLMYTPLVTNQGDNSLQEYFIGIKSIRIDDKRLSLNASLLSLDEEGIGGTKLSTIVPYTTMERTIYASFIEAYVKSATSMNMTRVASVAPFGLCFSSESIDGTQLRPKVPVIDLVLQSEMVKWRISGRNSMVRVSEEVMCLGFLDGGLNPRTSIVLGGYQLEETLLEFDVGASLLGFSQSLLMSRISCSDFKSNSRLKEPL